MEHIGLTHEEEIYYANYNLIDLCDECSDYVPITNYNDGSNYLTFIENKVVCQKCMKFLIHS